MPFLLTLNMFFRKEYTSGVAILKLTPSFGAAIMMEWIMLFPSPTQVNVKPSIDL